MIIRPSRAALITCLISVAVGCWVLHYLGRQFFVAVGYLTSEGTFSGQQARLIAERTSIFTLLFAGILLGLIVVRWFAKKSCTWQVDDHAVHIKSGDHTEESVPLEDVESFGRKFTPFRSALILKTNGRTSRIGFLKRDERDNFFGEFLSMKSRRCAGENTLPAFSLRSQTDLKEATKVSVSFALLSACLVFVVLGESILRHEGVISGRFREIFPQFLWTSIFSITAPIVLLLFFIPRIFGGRCWKLHRDSVEIENRKGERQTIGLFEIKELTLHKDTLHITRHNGGGGHTIRFTHPANRFLFLTEFHKRSKAMRAETSSPGAI